MLPDGTVTFLFTDIVGSTAQWESNPTQMRGTLDAHNQILQRIFESFGGHIFKTVGDAYCVAFRRAEDAVQSASRVHVELAEMDNPVEVRIGIHTGAIQPTGSDYFGPPVNKTARIQSAARPGQTLLSDATKGLLGAGVVVVDQGTHLLKDLLEPARLWQVGLGDFGPIRSIGAIPNNLPIQSTSFIGRDRELEHMDESLSKTRLITLTGAGGTGKSRLALQFAAENLERFQDGVWFCELAALPDRDDVARELAVVLKVPDGPQPPMSRLVSDLKAKECLVIIDNCEHVLESASQLAEAVVSTCPGVTLIATSREPLAARGESVFRVPSLQSPTGVISLSTLREFGSTSLFLDRLHAAAPEKVLTEGDASTVARICERLDGIPLAIELAAARSRAMALDQIEKRLDDRFRLLTGGNRNALSRQQTLRALIDWSVRLLDEREKGLFFDVSVFSDGWDLDAAESVCSSDDRGIDRWDVLDLLTSLVDKSLVTFEHASKRYVLLESMRQYAQEQLDNTERPSVLRNRHADYYLSIGADFEAEDANIRNRAVTRFSRDYENFRAAIGWVSSDPLQTHRALIALQQTLFGFDLHNRVNELLSLFEPLIRAKPEQMIEEEFESARAIYIHSLVVNRDPRGEPYLDAALAEFHNLPSAAQEKWCVRLAYCLFFLSRFAEAESFCVSILASDATQPTKWKMNHMQANCLFCLGRYREADAAFRIPLLNGMDCATSPRAFLVCGSGAVASSVFDGRLGDALAMALEMFMMGIRHPTHFAFATDCMCAFDQLALELGQPWFLALRHAWREKRLERRLYMLDPLDLKLEDYVEQLSLAGSSVELFEAAKHVADINLIWSYANAVAELKVDDFYGEGKYFPGLESLPPAPKNSGI